MICIYTVEVDFYPNESSKSTSTINLQFACNSSICDRMLQLTYQAENEVIRKTFVYCSNTSILLEGLTCGTNYSIMVSVIPDQTQAECILRRKYASTESCGGNTHQCTCTLERLIIRFSFMTYSAYSSGHLPYHHHHCNTSSCGGGSLY